MTGNGKIEACDMTPTGPGRPAGWTHVVQLFDNDDSLAAGVSAFVSDALARGETVLLLLTPVHLGLTAERLSWLGVDLRRHMRAGRIHVLDAQDMLDRVTRYDGPDPGLFDQAIGAFVRSMRERHGPLALYGELVDLLATRGDYAEAAQLESFWQRLGAEVPFRLLCGYSAVNFGNARTSAALREICGAHDSVLCDPGDALGGYLIQSIGTAVRPLAG